MKAMTTQNLTTTEIIKATTTAMRRLEWGSGRAALKTLVQELERGRKKKIETTRRRKNKRAL